MIYWCTDEVSQRSKLKVHRDRKQRYCKCMAHLTATMSRSHTYSHLTNATQASTYLTTDTLPIDDQDLETVKTLADARVSSSQITNFLSDRIG
ncbi:hypothetical protein JG688_00001629 [Phytophthora aleatoria]|uniref:Uncharacterized protein n=1 Tax=Phytophthora aleatoria TaxID=2496075 RepID=A0A8J5J360_9STRA|nr:hypothetical protein JG688_00001629 [Phytophthora aleatoria]